MRAIRNDVHSLVKLDLDLLTDFQGNLKDLAEEDYQRLKKDILDLGFSEPVSVWLSPDGTHNILNGHQRVKALRRMRDEGFAIDGVPASMILAESLQQAKRKVLSLTSQFGRMTGQGLRDFIEEAQIPIQEINENYRFQEIDMPRFIEEFFPQNYFVPEGDPVDHKPETKPVTMAERFLVPPFSVLDARQGYWRARKAQWLGMGIQSEVGRGSNLLGMSDTMLEPDPEKRAARARVGVGGAIPNDKFNIPNFYKKRDAGMTDEEIIAEHEASGSTQSNGTSIFDPVLTELVYRWFSPPDGVVVDPFAGGSVRGVVASKLGRSYFGGELRQEQVEENRKQATELCDGIQPVWACADSRDIDQTFSAIAADLIFSCPPYADLEVYSDDPKDISTLEYTEFMAAYEEIIAKTVRLLKQDRFACFVVGEVREKNRSGFYRNFVVDTIKAFEKAGLRYYNEMVLITSAGTLAMRAGRTFAATRKIGKSHQNVLVFCKGDPVKATEACGVVEIADLDTAVETEVPSVEPSPYGEQVVLGGEV